MTNCLPPERKKETHEFHHVAGGNSDEKMLKIYPVRFLILFNIVKRKKKTGLFQKKPCRKERSLCKDTEAATSKKDELT